MTGECDGNEETRLRARLRHAAVWVLNEGAPERDNDDDPLSSNNNNGWVGHRRGPIYELCCGLNCPTKGMG